MNQDVAVNQVLQSLNIQLGGLTEKQYRIIGGHLYCLYTAGYEAANRIQRSTKGVIRIDSKGNRKYFNSVTDAAKATCSDRWAIVKTIKGNYKQWKGYKFEYSKDE